MIRRIIIVSAVILFVLISILYWRQKPILDPWDTFGTLHKIDKIMLEIHLKHLVYYHNYDVNDLIKLGETNE